MRSVSRPPLAPGLPEHRPLRRSTAGLTLAELLTVVFLLAVVFTMVAQVMVPSAYLFHIQSTRSNVQQGPLLFTHHVQKAIINTQAESITYIQNPTALSWVDVRDDGFDAVTGCPRQDPRFSILYYDAAGGRIWRKTWPPGPPVSPDVAVYDFVAAREPLALSMKDLRTICATVNGTDRVLVKDVVELTIQDGADQASSTGALVLPLRFSITCEARAAIARSSDTQKERFTLESQVEPRSLRW